MTTLDEDELLEDYCQDPLQIPFRNMEEDESCIFVLSKEQGQIGKFVSGVFDKLREKYQRFQDFKDYHTGW